MSPTGIKVNLSNIGTNTGINIATSPATVLSSAIKIVMMLAIIAVLFMLIYGAFQWIISGGEKEAVANARNRITHALIGLAVLGLAFVIVTVIGNIVGINVLGDLCIPTLSGSACP